MEIRRITQPVRKCGKRKQWGAYLVTLAGGPGGILPHVSVVDTPIPVQRNPHRSPVIVDGSMILARAPESDWLAGSSLKSAEKKQGDQWAIMNFGMPLEKRYLTGNCRLSHTPDEAIHLILANVKYDWQIGPRVKSLGQQKVHEMPRCSEPYASMVRHLQAFATGDAAAAVGFVAAIWRLAYALQPGKRSQVIPTLSAILMYAGLQHDATDIYTLMFERSMADDTQT